MPNPTNPTLGLRKTGLRETLASMSDDELRVNLGALDPFMRCLLVRELLADATELRSLRRQLAAQVRKWRERADEVERREEDGHLSMAVRTLRQAADEIEGLAKGTDHDD